MSIHNLILDEVQDVLIGALIDDIPTDDMSRAGVVVQGPLQGNPDPDQARISIMLYENDPDAFYGAAGSTSMSGAWVDEVSELECGGSLTWLRRFTVKARCLFVNTAEDLTNARQYASEVRSRLERALLDMDFSEVYDEHEYVSRGVVSYSLKGEIVQAGGPPDAYDFYIKIRFDLLTTTGVKP